jgi:Icc-related predicted phosphoesterase
MLRTVRALLLAALSLVLASGPSLALQDKAQEPAPQKASSESSSTETPKPLRFAVVGDTGTADASQYAISKQMLAAYEKQPFELVLMVGDNIYGGNCAQFGNYFDLPYKELIAKGVPFYATLGNHDQKCAAVQLAHPKLNMGGKRFYNFAPAGDLVEFFTFDSTVVVEGKVFEQLDWLEKALSESKARWKIVFFHHPPYSPGSRHGDDPILISKVIPILKKTGVRIVITGHEHFFARIGDREGIEYIISGSGGKIHRKAINRQYPGFIAGNDEFHQFLTVTLSHDAFAFTVNSETGSVIYQETIPFEKAAAKGA